MKLIVRADDYGYTKTYNDGTIEAIENGIVTHVDIMFDTPGTIDALERIRNYPWISVGWHSHFWGRPILDPKEVPSMVDDDGKFKFRKNQKMKETCDFDEVYKESKAQMELCIKYLGRVPDCAWIQDNGTQFEKARKEICDEYGIVCNFASKPDREGNLVPAYDAYKHLDIYMPNQPATVYKTCYRENYIERELYSPVNYYINDEADLLKHSTVLTAWHPGYLDTYIMNESSMRECRVKDVDALCSKDLKQWIKDERVELINQRDALYGTSEYQNHLQNIRSELYVKKGE